MTSRKQPKPNSVVSSDTISPSNTASKSTSLGKLPDSPKSGMLHVEALGRPVPSSRTSSQGQYPQPTQNPSQLMDQRAQQKILDEKLLNQRAFDQKMGAVKQGMVQDQAVTAGVILESEVNLEATNQKKGMEHMQPLPDGPQGGKPMAIPDMSPSPDNVVQKDLQEDLQDEEQQQLNTPSQGLGR